VYPNPTNDFLNIKHNENIKEVKIHNVLGALVFHQILENHSQTTLNTSSLPPGIYTLTIHTSTQSSKHKFIKQ
jgi:hypothetical protein